MRTFFNQVKQTLARHCHATSSRKVEEAENRLDKRKLKGCCLFITFYRGVVRGRLKDKLHDLKRKLAEDS